MQAEEFNMLTVPQTDQEQVVNQEQRARWNSAGCAWIEARELLDQILAPFEDLLVAAVRSESAARVLDVGCGTGSTTRAIAGLVATRGRCVGIDISEPMISAARALARAQSAAACFIHDDAQTHGFEPASFDMIVSRFGVMFFDDCIRAFANLRQAIRDGGVLRFISWRSAAENAFMTTAERAAAPFLPNIPARVPDAPGQFALASESRIRHILEASGWTEADVQPIDVVCSFPEEQLGLYVTRLGPLGQVLQEVEEPTRSQIATTVRAAFEPYVHAAQVRFSAACWLVGARAPSGSD
jgi:ubiquinone/menaquinone biosynthesis C-methylase UbiE